MNTIKCGPVNVPAFPPLSLGYTVLLMWSQYLLALQ